MKLWIRSGLRSFGLEGADWEEIEAETFDQARLKAKELSRLEYDQYAGVTGIRTLDQIIAEDQVTLMDAEEIYRKDREDQIVYEVRITNPNAIETEDQYPLFRNIDDQSLMKGSEDDDDYTGYWAKRLSETYDDHGYSSYYSDVDGDDFTPEIEAEIKAEEEAERLKKLAIIHAH